MVADCGLEELALAVLMVALKIYGVPEDRLLRKPFLV